MNHTKFFEDIDQTGGYINRLVWIAGQLDSNTLTDLLDDMEPEDIEDCFPGFDLSNYDGDSKELKEYISSESKPGFLAECYFQHQYGFHFPEGSKTPTSWSSSRGVSTIYWVYAESFPELIRKMTKIGKSHHKNEIRRELKKKQTV
jgi:hypothetical protein